MYLNSVMEGTADFLPAAKWIKDGSTFICWYDYWRESLFERIMRLFVWENTDPVPPKEIESRLLLNGHAGVLNFENELTVMFGSFFGVTKYYDDWESYTVRCPIYSGQRTIGKDVAVIDNNSLRNSTYALVHHYAIMLAHIEVTLVSAMINARDAGGVPVATTQKQKTSLEEYYTKLWNGKFGIVTDIGNLGLEYMGCDRHTQQSINDLLYTRSTILKSFYSDIGVRSAFEKKNNTVQAEVEADTSLLLLNLSDMIQCREKGADDVNKMFGTNWEVHIAKEIDYSTENERVQFNSVDTSHRGNENIVQGGGQSGDITEPASERK